MAAAEPKVAETVITAWTGEVMIALEKGRGAFRSGVGGTTSQMRSSGGVVGKDQHVT